jgi:hypothetical protein
MQHETRLRMIEVRPVVPLDEKAWRSMWADYNAFYEATVPDHVTRSTWGRILDPGFPFGAVLAVDGDTPMGFANYVVGPYTWSDRPHCLMEDLFVIPNARSR